MKCGCGRLCSMGSCARLLHFALTTFVFYVLLEARDSGKCWTSMERCICRVGRNQLYAHVCFMYVYVFLHRAEPRLAGPQLQVLCRGTPAVAKQPLLPHCQSHGSWIHANDVFHALSPPAEPGVAQGACTGQPCCDVEEGGQFFNLVLRWLSFPVIAAVEEKDGKNLPVMTGRGKLSQEVTDGFAGLVK